MTKRSLVFRSAALLSAGGLMAGYVVFQASGGEGKLLPGSKSKIVYKGPTSNPATQPTPAAMFGGSKSIVLINPAEAGGAGGTIIFPQPATGPALMSGSKSTVMLQPGTLQGIVTFNASDAKLLNTPGSATLILATTQPATQPATRPAAEPAK